MATYFAKIESDLVTQVIVADQSFIDTQTGTWLETDYYTRGNVHYGEDGQPDGGTPFRGNYAGIGYTYDSVNNVFIGIKPYPSWVMNPQTWLWEAPVPYPSEGGPYRWDEATLSWVLVDA